MAAAARTTSTGRPSGTLTSTIRRTALTISGFAGRSTSAGTSLNTIRWDLGVDNGFALYLNGILIAASNQEGFAARWEYGGFFNAAQFLPGTNYIALALEDHGSATAFDMQIEGTPQAAVPEPATIALLGLGAVGLLATRKRLF